MKSGCCILMVEIENGENLRKFSMEMNNIYFDAECRLRTVTRLTTKKT